MVPSAPYSGFLATLSCWGTSSYPDTKRELKWQKDIAGNSQKIKQFQEVVGALQDFKTYLFVKPGSIFVMVIHSLMKFIALSKYGSAPRKRPRKRSRCTRTLQ